MAGLAFLTLLAAITTVALVIPDGAKAGQDVVNSAGKVQFTVDGSNFAIPNQVRDTSNPNPNALKHVYFNFTLMGSKVTEVKDKPKDKPHDADEWLLTLEDETTMEVTSKFDQSIHEYFFTWPEKKEQDKDREVCFELGKEAQPYWYNTFQQKNQEWPMNTKKAQLEYPLNAIQNDTDSEFQYVIGHLFINTFGYAIMLNSESPLWYRVEPNSGSPRMCIKSQRRGPYPRESPETPLNAVLTFSVYAGMNIKQVYDMVANKQDGGGIPKPSHVPSERMFTNPTWTITQGRSVHFASPNDLVQGRVIDFVEKFLVQTHKYTHGVISLDSWWHTDLEYLGFDRSTTAFPTPKQMAIALNKTNVDYKLELVVTPYVSTKSEAYLSHKNLYVKDSTDTTEWTVKRSGVPENGYALLDFSNTKAVKFFTEKLKALKSQFLVDSFVFDPITLYDNNVKFHNPVVQQASVMFTRNYLKVAEEFGGLTTVREGHGTQSLPVFVRMADRKSDESGLKSLIPTALALSLGGYSFFIPDVVGGKLGAKPSEELYIRWAQAVTMMPAIQFDWPPWDIGTNATVITHKCVEMHVKNQATFMALAEQRHKFGTPMIRPMWYVAPEDPETYKLDDQFMLGDSILVAPQLKMGEEEDRNVYLPRGHKWRLAGEQEIHDGGRRIVVKTPLDGMVVYLTKVI